MDHNHPFALYQLFSEFRVLTFNSIKSKRRDELVFRDIDAVFTRIANSIQKGYTLQNKYDPFYGEYRPYPYFKITWSRIDNDRSLQVTITRKDFSLTITEDSWSKFIVWCTKWRVSKPSTMEACKDTNYYIRWW